MWLSILDADLPLQLTFLLMENSWAAPGALRNDGWLQTVAVQTWGAQARMLAPSFYPVFGSFPPEPHRYVSVETATLLRRDVAPDSTPVRARAWREVCGPEKGPGVQDIGSTTTSVLSCLPAWLICSSIISSPWRSTHDVEGYT